jgi:hypothetical protein
MGYFRSQFDGNHGLFVASFAPSSEFNKHNVFNNLLGSKSAQLLPAISVEPPPGQVRKTCGKPRRTKNSKAALPISEHACNRNQELHFVASTAFPHQPTPSFAVSLERRAADL